MISYVLSWWTAGIRISVRRAGNKLPPQYALSCLPDRLASWAAENPDRPVITRRAPRCAVA